MTTEFVSVPASWSVRRTLEHIRRLEHTRETVYSVDVLDQPSGVLRAAVPLARHLGMRIVVGAGDGVGVSRR